MDARYRELLLIFTSDAAKENEDQLSMTFDAFNLKSPTFKNSLYHLHLTTASVTWGKLPAFLGLINGGC